MGTVSTVATLNTVLMRSLSNVAYVSRERGCVCCDRGLITAQADELGDDSRHWCSHLQQLHQAL